MSDAATRISNALADRYRVERELGAGGMATVYLAEDLKHRRKVAIKVLRPELAAVIGADRFLREIETIAGLQHPHILGLIDSGEVNGTAYYVMPFVEGELVGFQPTSNQSGREEVYLRRLAGGDEQVQVSVGGGTEPVWSPNGQELYYRGGPGAQSRAEPTIMAATIATRPALAVTSRKALFSASGIVTANPHGNFDVSPDGKAFAYVRASPSTRVMVIQNLPAMVARRRAGGRGTP